MNIQSNTNHPIELVKPGTLEYIFTKLQEESAEIIQAVSKIRRFGPDNKHPDRDTTNLQEFIGEVEDFLALLAALEAEKMFDLTNSQQNILAKLKAIYRP
jgi:NTP pyrophosphatase (non-canonical NTP hydrolase)